MSSSEKRTIKINPELFKVSEKNTSRKKRGSSTEIKVRTPKPIRNKTLRKSVLNILRKNVRDRESAEYKNTMANPSTSISTSASSKKKSESSIDEFTTDFERSIQYFNTLNDKEEPDRRQKQHNTTFKRELSNSNHNNNQNHSIENSISNVLPDVFNNVLPIAMDTNPMQIISAPLTLPPPPKYGCLKGGSLPTYRTYTRGTQRNHGIVSENPSNHTPGSYSAPPLFNNSSIDQPQDSMNEIKIKEGLTKEQEQRKNEEKQTILTEAKRDLIEKKKKMEILSKKKSNHSKNSKNPKLKYLKQRKIYKRTYHVGRSKIYPKVGVLISNKTIRQRISTNALHLKQTPMPEVKKFLIKKGFIKIGSIAPNDVLRQMYECAHLMCGEIENHNPENLLYNYFNDRE